MPVEFTSRSLDDTAALAARLAPLLGPGDILALDAPMGAGKTTLIRALATALGVPPALVSSPTFVLVHQYPTAASYNLVHIDAYRLTSAEDLDALGWDRLSAATNVLVIEWAPRVAEALPAERTSWLTIHPLGQGPEDTGQRLFAFSGPLATRLDPD